MTFMSDNINENLLDKINELSRKAKSEGLTEEETIERYNLRKSYLENFRKRFRDEILDNIYIVEEDGTKNKLLKNENTEIK